jgi:multiple sugar transport system permease protein
MRMLCLPEGLLMAVRRQETVPALGRGRVRAYLNKSTVRESLLAYVFMGPIIVIVLLLIAYPFLNAIYLSMTDKIVGYPPIFVGLKNYVELWESSQYRQVVYNSVVYTIGSVAIKLALGMAMALVLNRALKGRQFFRGILLLPWIIPTVVIAITWRWLFDLFRGLINVSLIDLGLITSGIHWLGDPTLAMASVITANVWRGFPFFGVSLLAAMQVIPEELYEAAEVDGASAAQRFWHITLPSIKGVLLVVTLLSTIWTLNDFNIVHIMTRGGPGTATHIFATFSYELGIQAQKWGQAVAASMYSLPVLALLIILIARYLQQEDHK